MGLINKLLKSLEERRNNPYLGELDNEITQRR